MSLGFVCRTIAVIILVIALLQLLILVIALFQLFSYCTIAVFSVAVLASKALLLASFFKSFYSVRIHCVLISANSTV